MYTKPYTQPLLSFFKEGLAPRPRARRVGALVLLLGALVSFTNATPAFASTIYSQTDNSGSIVGTGTYNVAQDSATSTFSINTSDTLYGYFLANVPAYNNSYPTWQLLDASTGVQCAYMISSGSTTVTQITSNEYSFSGQMTFENPTYCRGSYFLSANEMYATTTTAYAYANAAGTNMYAIITQGAPYVPQSITNISTVTPANGVTIATGTPVTIGLSGYVAPSDYVTGMTAVWQYQFEANNGIEKTFTFPITGSGSFSVSTTTTLNDIGAWTGTDYIQQPYDTSGATVYPIGTPYGQGTQFAATTTYFINGAYNSYDLYQNSVYTQNGDLINQQVASSTCALNFSTFNLGACALSFVIPTGGDPFAQFKTLTLAHTFPFAYAYQIAPIIGAIWDSPLAASTTISYNFDGFGTLVLFSQPLLTSVPFANLIKSLITAFAYFLGAYAIYKKVIKTHDNNSHV